MNALILVHADPAFTLGEVGYPVQHGFDKPEPDIICNQIDNAAVNKCVGGEPVVPDGEKAVFIIVDSVVAILSIAHGIRLQNEVRQRMAANQHE